MKKGIIISILITGIFLLSSCGLLNGHKDPSSFNTYKAAIDKNQKLFEISIHEHINESNMQLKRIDIKNISNRQYNDVLLDLILTDDAQNILSQKQAGVYGHIKPDETVSLYTGFEENEDTTNSITNGYVINYKTNYFKNK